MVFLKILITSELQLFRATESKRNRRGKNKGDCSLGHRRNQTWGTPEWASLRAKWSWELSIEVSGDICDFLVKHSDFIRPVPLISILMCPCVYVFYCFFFLFYQCFSVIYVCVSACFTFVFSFIFSVLCPCSSFTLVFYVQVRLLLCSSPFVLFLNVLMFSSFNKLIF